MAHYIMKTFNALARCFKSERSSANSDFENATLAEPCNETELESSILWSKLPYKQIWCGD